MLETKFRKNRRVITIGLLVIAGLISMFFINRMGKSSAIAAPLAP
jgi:hypothetical protein